jgi:hypothetical protein
VGISASGVETGYWRGKMEKVQIVEQWTCLGVRRYQRLADGSLLELESGSLLAKEPVTVINRPASTGPRKGITAGCVEGKRRSSNEG